MLYVLAVSLASVLLLVEPSGLDVIMMFGILALALYIFSLGAVYPIVKKNSGKVMSVVATVLVAAIVAFLGFAAVAGVAWLIGVYHAQV